MRRTTKCCAAQVLQESTEMLIKLMARYHVPPDQAKRLYEYLNSLSNEDIFTLVCDEDSLVRQGIKLGLMYENPPLDQDESRE